MREIKFRAWTGKEYDYDMCINPDGKMMDMDCGEYVGQFDYPIEQYTGLKDKNGKEIYEGDVCKCDAIHGKLTEVTWDKILCRFIVKTPKKCDYVGLTEYTRTSLEIIGNIHEELL